MKFQDLYISGLGVHLPPPVAADDAIADGSYSKEEQEISGWVSVCAAGSRPAPDMAVRATDAALKGAVDGPEDIGLVLHTHAYHQGPDMWSAQNYIQRETLGGSAPAFVLQQGCNAMVSGMELAGCHLAAAPDRSAALITGADNFTVPQIDRWRLANNVAVGDGAAAVVLSSRSGFARVRSVACSSVPALEGLHRGDEPLHPPTGSTGGRIDLRERALQFADSTDAMLLDDHELIGSATASVVERALSDAEAKSSDIARVTHVNWGHERFLSRTLVPLGLSAEQGTLEFGRRVGHLGTCDQFAGLHHLLETGALRGGDLVLMIGVGGGLSLACAVIELLTPWEEGSA
ncbi:ketoacyl-ACP synthase III family protein [Streptomonospora algeriensis]|uniref:Ketoacyl-ACP synthase III family protein n=1 Tax=Streptomonospora algeriensis TaxID=995084 RepID=A0ABW3BC20_9ACTN